VSHPPPTLNHVPLPVPIRRMAYRVAHRLLRTWWFLRRPPLHGVKCVLTDGDRVLLVRHTYGRREWDLPGGTPRRGEAPIEAASREMQEELGIQITDWQPLGDLLRISYRCQDTLHCFHAELSSPELALNRAEIDAEQWFPKRHLPTPLGRHVQPVLSLARDTPASAAAAGGAPYSPGPPSDSG
jgi:8-oxo-dGTP pyrophosphatase MutT (NUDIX family)